MIAFVDKSRNHENFKDLNRGEREEFLVIYTSGKDHLIKKKINITMNR